MAIMPINVAGGDLVQLARTNPLHYTANGLADKASGVKDAGAGSFESAMLKALDSVNADQASSNDLIKQALVDPESVDVHQVTMAMAEASLSLNLAKTLLSRVVTAWKDIINIR